MRKGFSTANFGGYGFYFKWSVNKIIYLKCMHQDYYVTNNKYSEFLEGQERDSFKKYVDFVKKYSTRNSNVLDIGCGTGIFLETCEKVISGKQLFGVDISETSIKKAVSKKLQCKQYDGAHLPFNKNEFSIVGSFNVLEHVNDPDKFLNEQLRVLKKDGYLFIICPNFLSVTNSYHHHTKGIIRKLKNITILLKKLFLSNCKWQKMKVIEREDFQADDDACNMTNPVDILRWARKHDLKLEYWSSQTVYKSGIVNKLDFSFLKLFFGSSFMIFQKLKNQESQSRKYYL